MKQKANPLFSIYLAAVLFLAGCGPAQVQEGQLYVARENATIATYIGKYFNPKYCELQKGSIVFGVRETTAPKGRVEQVPTTSIIHTGKNCNENGHDYIEDSPEKSNFTLIKKPEDIKKAEEILCAEPKLQGLNPELGDMCKGRTK